MAGPYDYSLNTPNPLQSFMGAYSLGSQIQQGQAVAEAQRIKNEQARAEQSRQNQIMSMYQRLRRPGATAQDYTNLSMLLSKDQSDALLDSFKTKTEAENAADLEDSSRVFAAFKSGNTDLAINLLKQQSEAERASGNDDAARGLDEWIQKAESGDEGKEAIEDMLGIIISMMPGGDKAMEAAIKYADERRKELEHPDIMAKARADKEKAESDAEKAAIDAKYAEEMKLAELKDKAAELGLTKEQTNETIARTKKLDAETAGILLETAAMEKAGGIDPEKKFIQEEKLRGEYQKRIASYLEMTQTYDRMKVSSIDQSGAGDVALVTGFMKMLDPGSVVRESEFATARDTAGLYGTLESVLAKVKSGKFLTPQQRKDFTDLAGKYMDASRKYEEKHRKDLGAVVDSYGLSSTNVFGSIAEHPKSSQSVVEKTMPKETPKAQYNIPNFIKRPNNIEEVDY